MRPTEDAFLTLRPRSARVPRAVPLLMITAALASMAAAQEPPADSPDVPATADGVTVDDTVILRGSAFVPGLNLRQTFVSTLPRSVAGRRAVSEEHGSSADGSGAMPVGLILLGGAEAENVDVLLEFTGRGVASLPVANVRSGRMLWSGLTLTDETAATLPLPQGHWLRPIRAATPGAVRLDAAIERFLLYDVEVQESPPVRLAVEEEVWSVANFGRRAVRAAGVFRPVDGGRFTLATVDLVDAAADDEEPAEDAATEDAATEDAASQDDAGESDKVAAAQAAAQANAAGGNVAQATAGEDTRWDGPSTRRPLTFGPPEDLEALTREYAAAQDLPEAAALLLQAVLKESTPEQHALLVYRMDPAELDRILPLEVTPQPARIRRAAFVLIDDADPTVDGTVRTLIAQLGDESWTRREAAQEELTRLGRTAQTQLKEAASHEDAEIADRVGRLLRALEKPGT